MRQTDIENAAINHTPLTPDEILHAKRYANGSWALLRRQADTGIETHVRKEDLGNGKYKLHFRETQPCAPVIEENKFLANEWSGWAGKNHGAVVARVPVVEWNAMKLKCGWDGGEYDARKMNKLLNDGDYAAFRTGGGKLKT